MTVTVTVQNLRQLAGDNGADLMGVAPAERLAGAPEGHRPVDLLPGARSVIVCARRIPRGAFDAPATVYQNAMNIAHQHLDRIAMQLALAIDEAGGRAIPIPSDEPYRHWEAQRMYGRGDLSHKHAAEAAGLGRLGRNSLLITREFGNRVHLVSVVTTPAARVPLSPSAAYP
jgi:epoxyqueuosine reductase